MLFMVIERFRDNDMTPVYRRLEEGGRMLPEGLRYVDSWIAADFRCCYQVMECDDASLLQQWILAWQGTGVTMEIVPVVRSATTRQNVLASLRKDKPE